jgi:hypothetical protein
MELLSPTKAAMSMQHDEAEPSCDDEDHGHDDSSRHCREKFSILDWSVAKPALQQAEIA